MSPESPEPIPDPSRTIEVHQRKSNFFRVVHADGVWCGVNPYRQIHVTFYSERFPIPRSVFFALDEKGFVKGEERREGKQGWFRELEVDVVLSVDAARTVCKSLEDFITIAENLGKAAAPEIKS